MKSCMLILRNVHFVWKRLFFLVIEVDEEKVKAIQE